MADIMTIKEAAVLWNISERRISELCKQGRIEGVWKKGRSWVIPLDAQKPVDSRVKSSAYRKTVSRPVQRKSPQKSDF